MAVIPGTRRHGVMGFVIVVSVFLWFAIAQSQSPSIQGIWYGTVTPPGAPPEARFQISVNFQKKGEGWMGTLLMEDGNSVPLSEIVLKANAISFSVDRGPQPTTFAGTFSGNAAEISGEFKQAQSTFPFK